MKESTKSPLTVGEGIITLAQKHYPSGSDTTHPYPIRPDVPKRFWKELGIEERKGRGQLKVLEIYLDEPVLAIQEYAIDDGQQDWEDGEIWTYDLNKLPKGFAARVIKELKTI